MLNAYLIDTRGSLGLAWLTFEHLLAPGSLSSPIVTHEQQLQSGKMAKRKHVEDDLEDSAAGDDSEQEFSGLEESSSEGSEDV